MHERSRSLVGGRVAVSQENKTQIWKMSRLIAQLSYRALVHLSKNISDGKHR